MDAIRDITYDEMRLFGDIVARLERLRPGVDVRAEILEDVVRLTRSDFGASYVWHEGRRCFSKTLAFNMSGENLKAYDDWYQFHDPMTQKLRARRQATPVEVVISRRNLERSEFYNDFLARDGLHHGINVFVVDGQKDLGDLRIWRAKGRPDFDTREVQLLDVLERFIRAAMLRVSALDGELTQREIDVAVLVARGCTDVDIARVLGIGFSTVRTHLNRAMQKLGCANRAELAAYVSKLPG
jgi:DNA-binding CsgD family transcriptional regulator